MAKLQSGALGAALRPLQNESERRAIDWRKDNKTHDRITCMYESEKRARRRQSVILYIWSESDSRRGAFNALLWWAMLIPIPPRKRGGREGGTRSSDSTNTSLRYEQVDRLLLPPHGRR